MGSECGWGLIGSGVATVREIFADEEALEVRDEVVTGTEIVRVSEWILTWTRFSADWLSTSLYEPDPSCGWTESWTVWKEASFWLGFNQASSRRGGSSLSLKWSTDSLL